MHFDPDAPLAFSDFELTRMLGEGGMGAVHEALQKSLNKRVALKILKNISPGNRHGIQRFIREGRAVAQLRHPNIVDVHGIGRTPDGGYFLVMDFIQGQDLRDSIQAGSFKIPEAVRIVIALAEAVHHAHEKGIIHRDLKPSNVLLESGKRPMLIDFGLAKHLQYDSSGSSASSTEIVGTPRSMAPEQIDPKRGEIGRPTDVFGLGVILFELLTGHPPFSGDSTPAVFANILSEDPAPLPSSWRPEVPLELDADCNRCLKKKPADRFQTARDLALALKHWLESTQGAPNRTAIRTAEEKRLRASRERQPIDPAPAKAGTIPSAPRPASPELRRGKRGIFAAGALALSGLLAILALLSRPASTTDENRPVEKVYAFSKVDYYIPRDSPPNLPRNIPLETNGEIKALELVAPDGRKTPGLSLTIIPPPAGCLTPSVLIEPSVLQSEGCYVLRLEGTGKDGITFQAEKNLFFLQRPAALKIDAPPPDTELPEPRGVIKGRILGGRNQQAIVQENPLAIQETGEFSFPFDAAGKLNCYSPSRLSNCLLVGPLQVADPCGNVSVHVFPFFIKARQEPAIRIISVDGKVRAAVKPSGSPTAVTAGGKISIGYIAEGVDGGSQVAAILAAADRPGIASEKRFPVKNSAAELSLEIPLDPGIYQLSLQLSIPPGRSASDRMQLRADRPDSSLPPSLVSILNDTEERRLDWNVLEKTIYRASCKSPACISFDGRESARIHSPRKILQNFRHANLVCALVEGQAGSTDELILESGGHAMKLALTWQANTLKNCVDCTGTGKIKCRNPDCVQGKIPGNKPLDCKLCEGGWNKCSCAGGQVLVAPTAALQLKMQSMQKHFAALGEARFQREKVEEALSQLQGSMNGQYSRFSSLESFSQSHGEFRTRYEEGVQSILEGNYQDARNQFIAALRNLEGISSSRWGAMEKELARILGEEISHLEKEQALLSSRSALKQVADLERDILSDPSSAQQLRLEFNTQARPWTASVVLSPGSFETNGRLKMDAFLNALRAGDKILLPDAPEESSFDQVLVHHNLGRWVLNREALRLLRAAGQPLSLLPGAIPAGGSSGPGSVLLPAILGSLALLLAIAGCLDLYSVFTSRKRRAGNV